MPVTTEVLKVKTLALARHRNFLRSLRTTETGYPNYWNKRFFPLEVDWRMSEVTRSLWGEALCFLTVCSTIMPQTWLLAGTTHQTRTRDPCTSTCTSTWPFKWKGAFCKLARRTCDGQRSSTAQLKATSCRHSWSSNKRPVRKWWFL